MEATRTRTIERIVRARFERAGLHCSDIAKNSVKKWHTHPSWVDAAVAIHECSHFFWFAVGETARPLKYRLFPEFSYEPNELGVDFDVLQLEIWLTPKRRVEGIDFPANRMRHVLAYCYQWFHSPRGLQRIVDAHIAELRAIAKPGTFD